MCGSNSSTVQSTSGPPQQFLQAYTDVYNQAKGLTGQPYQAYAGPMVAGFSPDQLSAFGTIQNIQGLYQPYLNQAASYYQTAAQPISPMGFSAYGWENYAENLPQIGLDYLTYAGRMSERAGSPIDLMEYDISPYESAYTTNVTNALSDLYAENNAAQYNQIRGNAAAQGAFGGDREAVAEAETARQQNLAQQATLAQVQQQGFAQAQEEFNKQQAIDLQRQLAERQYAMGAGQLGLGIGQGMWNEFNTQQALNNEAQQASAWLQNYAGTNVANLGQLAQNLGLAGAQAQLSIGDRTQQLGQQLLNVPYYQFMQQQAYPYQQTGWLSNIATGLGGASGGTASTTYPGPSTLGQVAGLGTAGVGLLGATGAFGSDGWLTGSSGQSGLAYNQQFSDFGGFSGGGDWVADGGAVPRRAPGGAVWLAVPPEFGGGEIPTGLDSYIPGANGMGAEPANKEGGGLHKMFMQPVTTQTQQQSSGGGLSSILGLATKALPLFLEDGGVVEGYAGGGAPVHPAAPIVADLINVRAPSSYGPADAAAIMPVFNYAPTFDTQGYPTAMSAVPRDWQAPPPLQIPMVNGIMNRAVPAPAPVAPDMMMSGAPTVPDLGMPTMPLPFDMGIGDLSQGGADGGHVGLGLGYNDGGSAGAPVPMGMPDPAQQLAEKIRRIQELEKLRVEDRFPRFSNLPRGGSARDDGGMVGLSGYIPPPPRFAGAGMGPPKPPTMPGWKPDDTNDSLLSLIKSAKTVLGESLGGAVQPSATPLQYDDGGMVPSMMGQQSPPQQRALLQQYQNLSLSKLHELAMRYPPGSPQGEALQQAIRRRQMNPGRPTGEFGMKDGGTPDDWIEPPPRDWRPGEPIRRPDPPSRGLATGGDPEDLPLFGPDTRDVMVLAPNDVSGVTEQPMGGLSLPSIERNPIPEVGPDRTVAAPSSGLGRLDTNPYSPSYGFMKPENGASALRAPPSVPRGTGSPPASTGTTRMPVEQAAPLVRQYESKSNYNVGYGGVDLSAAPKDENGFPIWEGKTFVDKDGKLKRTHAAGAYQFQPGTWAQYAKRLGIKDFSQESQDRVFAAAYADQGFAPWAPYNSALASAVGYGVGTPRVSGIGVPGLASAPGQVAVEPLSGQAQGLAQRPDMMSAFAPREKSDLQNMMSSPWMALIGAGAGMLASRSPYPGVAIGEGLQTGLKVAGQQVDRENKEELADIRRQSAGVQAQNMVERANLIRSQQAETAANNAARQADAADKRALTAARDADRSAYQADKLRQTGETEAARAAAREAEHQRRVARDAADKAMAEQEHERKKLHDEVRRLNPTVFDRKVQAAKDAGMSEMEALAYANGQRPMSEQHIARAAAQHARKEFDNISQDYLNPQREQFIKMSPAQKDAWLQKRGAFWQQQIRSGFGNTAPAAAPSATSAAPAAAPAAPSAAPVPPAGVLPPWAKQQAIGPNGRVIYSDGKSWFNPDRTPYQ